MTSFFAALFSVGLNCNPIFVLCQVFLHTPCGLCSTVSASGLLVFIYGSPLVGIAFNFFRRSPMRKEPHSSSCDLLKWLFSFLDEKELPDILKAQGELLDGGHPANLWNKLSPKADRVASTQDITLEPERTAPFLSSCLRPNKHIPHCSGHLTLRFLIFFMSTCACVCLVSPHVSLLFDSLLCCHHDERFLFNPI